MKEPTVIGYYYPTDALPVQAWILKENADGTVNIGCGGVVFFKNCPMSEQPKIGCFTAGNVPTVLKIAKPVLDSRRVPPLAIEAPSSEVLPPEGRWTKVLRRCGQRGVSYKKFTDELPTAKELANMPTTPSEPSGYPLDRLHRSQEYRELQVEITEFYEKIVPAANKAAKVAVPHPKKLPMNGDEFFKTVLPKIKDAKKRIVIAKARSRHYLAKGDPNFETTDTAVNLEFEAWRKMEFTANNYRSHALAFLRWYKAWVKRQKRSTLKSVRQVSGSAGGKKRWEKFNSGYSKWLKANKKGNKSKENRREYVEYENNTKIPPASKNIL